MTTPRPDARPTRRTPPLTGTCPPGIVDASVASFFDVWSSAVRHGTDYWVGLLDRRATPADVLNDLLRWGVLLTDRRPPTWSTPHRVLREWPVARLRDFTPDPVAPDAPGGSAAGEAPPSGVPVLILPPQAGHDSCIVDYAPGQSQVRTALDAGVARVLSLDWIGAGPATRDAGIEDYLTVIRQTVQDVGGRVDLVGDCQGGWLAVLFTALHPEAVRTLTIAGAPIDFHAGEPLIHDWIQLLSPDGRMDFYRFLVATGDGALPGEVLLNGFKAMQPEGEVDRTLGLLAHLDDEAYVERYARFENWFQHTQPIPGAFYLWIVEHLFQRNELVRGELVVEGRVVDLAAIECPLYLLAGSTDHITPPPQVFALADFASTPADRVTRLTVSGGHLGLFMGHGALRDHWAPVFGELAGL